MRTNDLVLMILFSLLLVSSDAGRATEGDTAQVTYVGELEENGTLADGQFDFIFELYDSPDGSSGRYLGSTAAAGVPVVDGRFSVELSPPQKLKAGDSVWMEIHTRRLGDAVFSVLEPRRRLVTGGTGCSVSGDLLVSGSLGINVTSPGQRLHIGDGNLLLEGGGETALIVKRDVTFTGGPSGESQNPIFSCGRIVQAGDGDPEFRCLYSDDMSPEITVLEFDRKGIVASVKSDFGSHFEGFISGDPEPLFRLNSFPAMQLELGPGGSTPTDAIIRRPETATISFLTGGAERMRINNVGRVGIGTDAPMAALHVAGDLKVDGMIMEPSDLRLKSNVRTLDSALEKLVRLRGVSFERRGQSGGRAKLGVIAQEVEREFPELVVADENGYKAVDYSGLMSPVIEALKELRAENEALKALVCLDHPISSLCS